MSINEAKKSNFPVVGHHFLNGRRIGGIYRGIGRFRQVEGFATLDAGAAATAVQFPSLVAGPGFLEGNVQFGTEFDDVGLGDADEGAIERNLMPIRQLDGGIESVGELGATVGIDGVVPGVGGDDEANGDDGCLAWWCFVCVLKWVRRRGGVCCWSLLWAGALFFVGVKRVLYVCACVRACFKGGHT